MRFLYILSLLFLFGGLVSAQDYILSISGGTISEGGSGSLTVTLDSSAGADVQGWSFGACNDTASLVCTDAVDGSTTATVNQGGPPGFNQIGLFDEGFTVGVVICFTGCAILPPGTGYELNIATYDGIAEGTTSVDFCDTLGSPPVVTVIVVERCFDPSDPELRCRRCGGRAGSRVHLPCRRCLRELQSR